MFQFSVLMSVYHKENPEFFNKSLESTLEQTLCPNEIVLVQDGPLTDALYTVIHEYKKRYKDLIKIVALEKNVGLGEALRIGVLACSNDFIARMDTDDIAVHDRFEKQASFIASNPAIDLFGGYVALFRNSLSDVFAYRKVPVEHGSIIKTAKIRCPFNHNTVMYRKKAVLDAGNYSQAINGLEDYDLWVRMIMKKSIVANIPEVLVYYRSGEGLIQRRTTKERNSNYFILFKKFLSIHFINHFEYARNISALFFFRYLSGNFFEYFYNTIFRSKKL